MKLLILLASFVLIYVSLLLTKVQGTAIVNGHPAFADEFPFMAALGWVDDVTGKVDYLCGGALIASKFILTAAHCLFFRGNLPSLVQIGGGDLRSEENENRTIQDYFVHPDYSSTQAYNDIALLLLDSNSKMRAARVWSRPIEHIRDVTAIGYGTTQFAGMRSDYLQKVNLQIMPEEMCKPFFNRQRKFKSGISSTHICAGDIIRFGDTCQGDSGGPLLFGSRFVIGITSVGQGCSGNPPAVYTRVSSFIIWIRKILHIEKMEINIGF